MQVGTQLLCLGFFVFQQLPGRERGGVRYFSGPYTVTHHKSTLLLAGMFSFINAGSASNQSNHMFKLGPIHQGTLERGAKTTFDSYILLPARVGAFFLVIGRHVNHSYTSKMCIRDSIYPAYVRNADGSIMVDNNGIEMCIRDSVWP